MKRTAQRVLAGLALAALGSIVLGCGGDDEAPQGVSGGQAPQAVSGDSPEAVFKTAKTALEQKDYGKFAACLTPESQEAMAGVMAFGGMMMKAFGAMVESAEQKEKLAQLDAVFKKHGLDPEKLQQPEPAEPSADPQKAFAALAGPIADKAAFIGDMMKALEGLDDEGESPAEALLGELVDVKITDGKATGSVVRKVAGQEQREPIEFRKVNGSWRIHETMDQMQGGPPGDMGEGFGDIDMGQGPEGIDMGDKPEGIDMGEKPEAEGGEAP